MSVREYTDFDVAIEAEGEAFVAKVLASPAGQATGQFSLPFSPVELENFVLKVGRTRSGVRKMGSPEGTAAEKFGKRLYEAVFAGEVGISFRRSIDEANLANRGLRVRIRTADAPTLNNIPWEFVWAEGLGRFIALSNQTPVVRFIDLPTRIRPLAVAPPLRILVMVSNPSDVDRLDVQREVDLLKEATKDLVASGRVELVVMEDANMASLAHRLRLGEFHIFHFIGHGGFADGDGVLVLEDSSERARPVKGQHLGTIFHDHGSLRLAVLNACEGARASAEDPFSGVAPSLIRQGIPAVIAMQFEITDTAAIQFAHEFYQAVADGYPVDAAVTEARKGIFSADNDLEWATPVLYMRAPDGMIFDLTAAPVPVPPAPPIETAEVTTPTPTVPELDLNREYERALLAIDSRKWIDAVRHLQTVLELDPANLSAKSHLEDAERRVRASALIEEGRTAHSAGRWEEAAASFREAAELDPDFADEDGLLADASWRVEVLRQPTEPAKTAEVTPVPVPEPAAGTPAPPQVEPATPVNVQVPAPAPAARPHVYRPRRRSRVWLVIALVIGIPFLIAFMVGAFQGLNAYFKSLSTTTNPTVFTQTTLSATTAVVTTAGGGGLQAADITAIRMFSPPQIDADPSEWTSPAQAKSQDLVAQDIVMPSLPTGLWAIGWDNEALYVFAQVVDAEVSQWFGTPDQLWQGDSVSFEFGPDPSGIGSGAGLRAEDVHVMLGPNQSGWEALVAINRVREGAMQRGHEEPDVEAEWAFLTDPSGYWIEARIPWHVLGVSNPVVGAVFAMNVNVSDGDGAFIAMVSNNSVRVHDDAGTWTTLVLGE